MRPRARKTLTGRAGVPQIGITSMIDVMMSLLILLIVIQPAMRKGLDVQLPPPDPPEQQSEPAPDQLTLHVRPGAAYALNDIPIAADELVDELRTVYEGRKRKVLFVKAHDGTRYGEVMRAIDMARGAGIEVVGLIPLPADAFGAGGAVASGGD